MMIMSEQTKNRPGASRRLVHSMGVLQFMYVLVQAMVAFCIASDCHNSKQIDGDLKTNHRIYHRCTRKELGCLRSAFISKSKSKCDGGAVVV